jgi:hypothetical protein
MFSPLSITLIHGVNHAVFVDPPLTTDQASAVGDWELASGKNLTTSSLLTATSTHSFGLMNMVAPPARYSSAVASS